MLGRWLKILPERRYITPACISTLSALGIFRSSRPPCRGTRPSHTTAMLHVRRHGDRQFSRSLRLYTAFDLSVPPSLPSTSHSRPLPMRAASCSPLFPQVLQVTCALEVQHGVDKLLNPPRPGLARCCTWCTPLTPWPPSACPGCACTLPAHPPPSSAAAWLFSEMVQPFVWRKAVLA